MTKKNRNRPTTSMTYKKLVVQGLNEALFFVSSFVVAESLVLLKPLLRQTMIDHLYYVLAGILSI